MDLRVTCNQPAVFAAKLHLVERIGSCAVNVNMGNAQISPQGFQTRYYLKINGQEKIMSVPRKHTGTLTALNQAEINNGPGIRWKDDHVKTIKQFYQKAPFLKEFFEPVAELITTAEGSIGAWTEKTMLWAMGTLGWTGKWVQDSEIVPKRPEDPSDWVFQLCKGAGATVYYCGKVASDEYLKYQEFEAAGIKVLPQEWKCPEYVQTKGPFVPNLCVLDALFNLGAAGTKALIGLAT